MLMFPPGKSGGLIEAAGTVGGGSSVASFRRVNPAASLKRFRASDGDRFHRAPRFRRVNPAASLKPLLAESIPTCPARMFPPGKSGGLIEASCLVFQCSPCACSFRRVNPAASLKQRAHRGRAREARCFRRVNPAASLKRVHYRQVLHGVRDVFPPGKSGGLIEARPAPDVRCAVRKRFRRVNPAASLKLYLILHHEQLQQTCFRRVNPAASLKP